MFLRFGVENHRSIRAYTEISWVATSQRDEPDWRMPSRDAAHGVLPALGVYGANASGKSNLLHAVLFLRDHVARSFTDLKPDEKVPWTPWFGSAAPTRVDADVVVDGIRYNYGFRWDAGGFLEEWLYGWPRGRQQIWFYRDHAAPDPWYFGPELSGRRREIQKATRSNALFLSTAAQYQHEQLLPIWHVLAGVRDDAPVELRGHPLFRADQPLLRPENREVVLQLLRAADLGVSDFRPVVNEERPADIARALGELIGSEAAKRVEVSLRDGAELWLTHTSRDGVTWELPPEQESRGTNILLTRLNDILGHLASARLMVIDEIDTSLHPEVTGALVDLFTHRRTNPKGAQLLFATHERGLLSRLRRDQVLLLDKGGDGGTTLRVASDFKGLRGREDLERVYSEGRIGGVPVLGDWHRAAEALHGRA